MDRPDQAVGNEQYSGVEALAPLPLNSAVFALPNRERCCAGCRFSAKEQKDRVCRFEPPHTAMFMVPQVIPPLRPGMLPQQQVQMVSQTWFPIVQDGQWCGKFEARAPR